MDLKLLKIVFFLDFLILVSRCENNDKELQKQSEDLLKAIEKKLNIDLDKAVDSVMSSINNLLKNDTTLIKNKLDELKAVVDVLKNDSRGEVEQCLTLLRNETLDLAAKTLHQVTICGSTLIGKDPEQLMKYVIDFKTLSMRRALKPMLSKGQDVYNLLMLCSRQHDTLRKVLKCVIAQSPLLKSTLLIFSGRIIDGVLHLTKKIAHGSKSSDVGEACILDMLNRIKEDASVIVEKINKCSADLGKILTLVHGLEVTGNGEINKQDSIKESSKNPNNKISRTQYVKEVTEQS